MAEESPSLRQITAHDIIEVYNPDVNCSFTDPEVHPNTNDTFVTYYNRSENASPIILEAGKVKHFPRYIAEHIKTHLTNHILTGMDLNVNDPKRKEIETEIIRSEETSYGEAPLIQPNPRPEQPSQVLDSIMESSKPKEALTQEVEEKPTDEVVKVSPPPIKEKPTRNQLLGELKELGVKTTGREKLDELEEKIKEFAGI